MTATGLATALVARTREIDPPENLLDALAPRGFAWLDGEGAFVTSGTAGRVPGTRAGDLLERIEEEDPLGWPGTGALAVGALPFHRGGSGMVVVPARVTGISADGRAWVTEIGDDQSHAAPEGPGPTRFAVQSSLTQAEWRAQVARLLDAIDHGRLQKAVLAREVLVTSDAPFDPRIVVDRLRRSQGGCFVFAAEGLVGATPELLVRRRGSRVESRPVAGTIARAGDGATDEQAETALRCSAKERLEHRLVVEAVVDGLRAAGVDVEPVAEPEVARLPAVFHLATRLNGRVPREGAPSALDLALTLHPTPAVGGTPRNAALDALRALEHFDRRRYAGPVGWVDARGNGDWAIALRCAELDGTQARLYAGAGVVSGSDPDAEWAETQVKLEPMLNALVRP